MSMWAWWSCRRAQDGTSPDSALQEQMPHKVILQDFLKVTYLPHKAVAEVSKDKEPIGRECAEFNWFESQLMSDSNEVRFK